MAGSLGRAQAQTSGPTVHHPDLAVRTVVAGLDQPITMAFLGDGDFLVLEKATGKVQRIVDGALHSTVLDLAVNFGSERGLLGTALVAIPATTSRIAADGRSKETSMAGTSCRPS
ncbi:MAG: hypothetical protein ABR576_02145 [Thermoanaerobaculia bacterium]